MKLPHPPQNSTLAPHGKKSYTPSMKKIGFGRSKAGAERTLQMKRLRKKSRMQSLVIGGKEVRARVIVCPTPMECEDLGSARGGKIRIPKAGAK